VERARVDGVTLEYEDSGDGEAVVGIDGVLVANTFRPLLAEPLLAGRYRRIGYHRRGYGGSSCAPSRLSLAQQAEDCRSLLSHLGVQRAHVIGHSFGGAIALQLALDAPTLVQTLSLLEAALVAGEHADAYRQSLAQSTQRYRQLGAEAIVDEFIEIRWPGYREPLARVLPGAFEQAVADAGTTFLSDIPGLLDWSFASDEARRVTRPVLVVLGGRSADLNPRFGEGYRLLLEWLPNSEGVVIPDAAHLMQLEKPGAVAQAVARFLARHPIGAG
jgi:pimeloyl-ACP methyl ester carboxylesterase